VSPADLTATLFEALGVSPRATIPDPERRPVPISRGRALRELWTG
jgi:hypothetical protein